MDSLSCFKSVSVGYTAVSTGEDKTKCKVNNKNKIYLMYFYLKKGNNGKGYIIIIIVIICSWVSIPGDKATLSWGSTLAPK